MKFGNVVSTLECIIGTLHENLVLSHRILQLPHSHGAHNMTPFISCGNLMVDQLLSLNAFLMASISSYPASSDLCWPPGLHFGQVPPSLHHLKKPPHITAGFQGCTSGTAIREYLQYCCQLHILLSRFAMRIE
jgi:hypothetical protein